MRVLYLTMNPNRGSTTAPTEGWFRALRPRGLQPVLVSDRVGAFHAWALGQGIAAYHVPLSPPSKTEPWRFLRSLWALATLARRHRVQLVHCNEHDIYPIGQYLARLCRLPVVVSVHWRMDRAFCRWAFRGARRPRRIFFVSKASLETCREGVEGVIPAQDWRVLYNAVDLEHYRPDRMERNRFRAKSRLGGELTVGTASVFRPRKQLEHLIEAVAGLSSRTVRLVLAGAPGVGDETYAAGILELGRRKLAERFLYPGYLDDLRGFMNGLDLYVNASREESFGISVLQALACGCPVVGYPSVAVAEQVLPGGGEIVAQDCVGELAAALDRWLGDPARLAAARIGARRRAEARYDVVRIADQLWGEYRSLVG